MSIPFKETNLSACQQDTQDMKSVFAFCILLYLFLFVDLNDARKDPGDYWKIIMKDQPIPEEIKALFHGDPLHPADARKKDHYVKGFDVTPNPIIYHAHMEPKEEKPHFHARKKDHFVKNFDVTPNAIIYHAHMEPKEEKLHFHRDPLNTADLRKKNQFVKDFDVTPNAIIYHAHMEPKEEKPHFYAKKKDHFVKDFDVTPNAIIYHAHMKPKKEKLYFHGDPLNPADERKKDRFVKDFDVTPNAIIYHAHTEPKEEKPHVKDFEPKHDMELKEEDSFVQHIKQKVEG